MTRPYGGVAYREAIDRLVGSCLVVDLIVDVSDGVARPRVAGIKLLYYGTPYGLAAHVHRDEAWREEGAVLVAIDFFKYEAEDRGIDQVLIVLLYIIAALTGEVVGI